jgi:two-component system nitrate/nitrite response regulator NarL
MEVTSRASNPTPILVVDDDEAFRTFVCSLLAQAGFDARSARTGEEALAAVRDQAPALVLLDVVLPGMTGYETCRAIRETFGETLPILFVSGDRTEPLDRVAGLMLGADDYIVKPFPPEELVARVRRALIRTRSLRSKRSARADALGLTGREDEILKLLASGLSHQAIADRLVISPKTVTTHVQHIFAKLGVHSRAEAVAVAYTEGLVSVEADRFRPTGT